mgnify:CR=1 FL=1
MDASNPGHPEQIAEVMRVLHDIGAAQVPQLLVFNKLDAIDAERQPQRLRDHIEVDGHTVTRVFVSALTGQGLPELRQALADVVAQDRPAETFSDAGDPSQEPPLGEFN